MAKDWHEGEGEAPAEPRPVRLGGSLALPTSLRCLMWVEITPRAAKTNSL